MKIIQSVRAIAWCINIAIFVTACNPASLVDAEAPSTVVHPGAVETREGALQLYNQAVAVFSVSLGGASGGLPGGHIVLSGLLTDEMIYGMNGNASTVDERVRKELGAGYVGLYHRPRVASEQAREALRRFYPDGPSALLGRLHALQGYSLVFFAEMYCSGIPLTRVPLKGSPMLTRAYSTVEVYERAIAQFDSAITLASDSLRFVYLAKIGKGRALLNLGRFEEAKTEVQDVPLEFSYVAEFGTDYMQNNGLGLYPYIAQVLDLEGSNGLAWSLDPRTAITAVQDVSGAMPVTAKYAITNGQITPNTSAPTTPIRVADGLEARLIAAEADLAAQRPTWLTILRSLRSSCIGTSPCAPVPSLTEANLPASGLIDAGTPAERLELLMEERAMWLFATGHRQGDLRRLARVYGRSPETLWPTGEYRSPTYPPYIVFPHPSNGSAYGNQYVLEHGPDTNNPLYTGCLDTNP